MGIQVQFITPRRAMHTDVKQRVLAFWDSLPEEVQDGLAQRAKHYADGGFDEYIATLAAMTECADEDTGRKN